MEVHSSKKIKNDDIKLINRKEYVIKSVLPMNIGFVWTVSVSSGSNPIYYSLLAVFRYDKEYRKERLIRGR